jgi:hypothetical protein
VIDPDKKSPVFVSMDYQHVNGELSKVPNEVVTVVAARNKEVIPPQHSAEDSKSLFLNITTASSNTNLAVTEQSRDSRLHDLAKEVVAASKELEYWRKALDLCKQGKAFKMLKGFSPVTGEPIYGDELQPSDALKDGLAEAIENCVTVKAQKEDEIRRLTTTGTGK